jgi:MATE family multidrug resistance protein
MPFSSIAITASPEARAMPSRRRSTAGGLAEPGSARYVELALTVTLLVGAMQLAMGLARLGALAAASHQIAANLAAVCYMVPLSLGIAISARVSWWRGTGNEAQAQRLAWLGLRIALVSGALLSGSLLLLRHHLPQVYTADPAVIALTATLLAWVALYHAADSLQCVCIFLMRCWRVTVAPLVVYCSLLWGGGLGGGYWLAYKNEATSAYWSTNPMPFWIGSGSALALVAIIFIYLLYRVLRAHK